MIEPTASPTEMPTTPIEDRLYDYKNPDFDVQAVVGDLPTRRPRVIKTFLKTTAGTLGLTAALFMGADRLSGEDVFRHHNEVAQAMAAVDDAEERILTLDYQDQQQQIQNLERLQEIQVVEEATYAELSASLGQACVTLFIPYTDGQRLGDVSEDSMVSDVINTPGLPCGDQPSAVRSNFRSFEGARLNVLDRPPDEPTDQEEVFTVDGKKQGVETFVPIPSDDRYVAENELDRVSRHLQELQSKTAGIEGDYRDAQWPNALWPGALVAVAVGLGAAARAQKNVKFQRYLLAQQRIVAATENRFIGYNTISKTVADLRREFARKLIAAHVPNAERKHSKW